MTDRIAQIRARLEAWQNPPNGVRVKFTAATRSGTIRHVAAMFEHAPDDLAFLLSALARAEQEKAEAEATIANERGAGEPPSPNWYWADGGWWREQGHHIASIERNPSPAKDDADGMFEAWLPTTWSVSILECRDNGFNGEKDIRADHGEAPTARDAMRLADLALATLPAAGTDSTKREMTK